MRVATRALVVLLLGVAACSGASGTAMPARTSVVTTDRVADADAPVAQPDPTGTSASAAAVTSSDTPSPLPTFEEVALRVADDLSRPRPDWLGTRVLPTDAADVAAPVDTPPELENRAFAPARAVTPDPTSTSFESSVAAVTPLVAGRSTWRPECPVSLDELRHVEVTFVGFDGSVHRGELLVHRDVADDVVEIFRLLHERRFPLEDVAIATTADLDAPPTGDGNVSGGFVCRAAVGTTRWSDHARGLALDLNPFMNPYVKDGRVIPELSTSYTDRTIVRPGMILAGDEVTTAFATIGWTWGGAFRSLTDPMHFSRDGG